MATRMKGLNWMVAIAVGALVGTKGTAEEDAASLSERVRQLEDRVRQVETSRPNGYLPIHLGGYGELHYNRLDGRGGAPDKREADLHRFVLFVGHEFSPSVRFNSEIEWEHTAAGANHKGYVQIEQAYLDFDLTAAHTLRAGVFVLPIGILNEIHEPTTFYGVERNRVENRIIPTTWFEGGAGLLGRIGSGWEYALYGHTGLKTTEDKPYEIRSGRQKVSYADSSDPAFTAALRWSGAGIAVGAAAQYQSDITQGTNPEAGAAWLGAVHLDARQGPVGLRALYAEWQLDGSGPKAAGADRQLGWYLELSYRWRPSLGLFSRYSLTDELAGSSESESQKRQWDVGMNWWPHEQVVVKADYQRQSNADGKNQNGINLGLGYQF